MMNFSSDKNPNLLEKFKAFQKSLRLLWFLNNDWKYSAERASYNGAPYNIRSENLIAFKCFKTFEIQMSFLASAKEEEMSTISGGLCTIIS